MKKIRIILGFLSTFVFGIFCTNIALAVELVNATVTCDGTENTLEISSDNDFTDLCDSADITCTHNLTDQGVAFEDFLTNDNWDNFVSSMADWQEDVQNITLTCTTCREYTLKSYDANYEKKIYYSNGKIYADSSCQGTPISELTGDDIPKMDGYTFVAWVPTSDPDRTDWKINKSTEGFHSTPTFRLNPDTGTLALVKVDSLERETTKPIINAAWVKECPDTVEDGTCALDISALSDSNTITYTSTCNASTADTKILSLNEGTADIQCIKYNAQLSCQNGGVKYLLYVTEQTDIYSENVEVFDLDDNVIKQTNIKNSMVAKCGLEGYKDNYDFIFSTVACEDVNVDDLNCNEKEVDCTFDEEKCLIYDLKSDTNPTFDIMLDWEEKKYNVTFSCGTDATGDLEDKEVGQTYGLLSLPTEDDVKNACSREHFNAVGFINKTTGEKIPFGSASITINSDAEFEVAWEPILFKITFSAPINTAYTTLEGLCTGGYDDTKCAINIMEQNTAWPTETPYFAVKPYYNNGKWYVLTGWKYENGGDVYKFIDGTLSVPALQTLPTGDVTLVPIWEPASCVPAADGHIVSASVENTNASNVNCTYSCAEHYVADYDYYNNEYQTGEPEHSVKCKPEQYRAELTDVNLSSEYFTDENGKIAGSTMYYEHGSDYKIIFKTSSSDNRLLTGWDISCSNNSGCYIGDITTSANNREITLGAGTYGNLKFKPNFATPTCSFENAASAQINLNNNTVTCDVTCKSGYAYNGELEFSVTGEQNQANLSGRCVLECVDGERLSEDGKTCQPINADEFALFFYCDEDAAGNAYNADGIADVMSNYPADNMYIFDITDTDTMTGSSVNKILTTENIVPTMCQKDYLKVNNDWTAGNSDIDTGETLSDLYSIEEGYEHTVFYATYSVPGYNSTTQYVKKDASVATCPDGSQPSNKITIKIDGSNRTIHTGCAAKPGYSCMGTFDTETATFTGGECSAIEYTITYKDNNDQTITGLAPTTYTVDTGVSELPTPTAPSGYVFNSWKRNGVAVTEIVPGKTGDIVLVATYDLDGTKVNINIVNEHGKSLLINDSIYTNAQKDSISFIAGDDATVGDITVKFTDNTNNMYRFDGFYSDLEYRNRVATNTLLSDAQTLYAKVLSTEFNVRYYCNSIVSNPYTTVKCEFDERGFASECKPLSYEDTGCTIADNQVFAGWMDDNGNVYYPGDGNFSQEHTSDTNLRAIIKDKFNVCLKNYRGKCADVFGVPETCTDGDIIQIPVYPDVLKAALGDDKVYTNFALINGTPDKAKFLNGSTPANDDERINFTCGADLTDRAGAINIELEQCPSCQSNDSATCDNVYMNGDNCTYSYTCKTGYHYGENDTFFSSITNNDTCKPNTYTVKFDANADNCTKHGGNVTPETMADMKVEFATPTEITDGTFACSTAELSGWSTDPNATSVSMTGNTINLGASDINNVASDGTITLYAIWGNKSFDINYVHEPDEEVSESCTFPSVWTNGSNLVIPDLNCVSKPYYTNVSWTVYAFDAKENRIGGTYAMGNTNFLNAVIDMQLKETPAYFEIKPDWKPVTYTAVFEGVDNEIADTIGFNASATLIASQTPAKPQTGYRFAQWCVRDNVSTEHCFNPGAEISRELFKDLLNIAANNSAKQIKFYASFVPETYEIILTTGDGGNFYSDSGKNEGKTKTIYQKYSNSFYSDQAETTPINAIPAPIRQGYKFAGFYTADGKSVSNDALNGFVNGTATFSENTTVSARWVPITYSVSLNWDGNLISAGQEQVLEPVSVFEVYGDGWYTDSDANIEMNPINMNLITNQDLMRAQHYTFNGFFTGKNGNGTRVIDNTGVANNVVFGNTDSTNMLYAYWTRTCYPVELFNGSESVGKIYYTKHLYSSGAETTTWYSDSTCSTALTASSLPSITPEAGYKFRGWTAEPVATESKYIYRGESNLLELVDYIPNTANWVFDAAGTPANNANTFSGTALYAHNSNQYNVTFNAPVGSGTNLDEVCVNDNLNGFVCNNGNSEATTTFIYDADNLYKLPVTPYLDSTNSGDVFYMLGWTECTDNTCRTYSNTVQWPVIIPSNTAKDLKFTAYFKQDANVCPANNGTVSTAIVSKDTIDEKNGIFFNCSYTCKPGYTFEGTEFANADAGEIVTLSSKFFLGDTTNEKQANCTPKVWPIVFDLNGGTGVAPTATNVKFSNQTPTLSNYEEPSRIGYTFLGWFWEGIVDGKYSDGSDVQIYTISGQPVNSTWANIPGIDRVGQTVKNGETIVVRALWAPKTYTITFNKNCQNDTCTLDGDKNATIANKTLEYDAHAFFTPTQEYARSGYAFAGWSLDKNATTGWDGNTELTGADIINDTNKNDTEIVLYAIWQPKTYMINLLPNHNSGAQTTVYEKYATGWCVNRQCSDTITSIPVPKRTGYTFTGYYTASQGGEIKFAPTQDETGEKIIFLDANNATFVTDNHLDTPVNLYAQWVANKYTVMLNGNNGTVTPANITVTYDSESNIDGFSASRVGYDFVGLYDAATGGTKYFDENGNALFKWNKTTEETTLYAQWAPKKSVVRFLANGGTLSDANGDVIQNSEFSLVVAYDAQLPDISGYKVSRDGYRFEGWADDSGNKYYNASNTPDKDSWNNEQENVTLKAVWTKYGASKVDIDTDNGILSGYTSVESCVEDTPTWALPTADQISRVGYVFNGWKLDGKTVTHVEQGVCKGNATLTYTAQWIPITYTVLFNGNNSTSGTMTSQTFTFGNTQSLFANKFERNNYEFIGWSTNKNATVAEYKDGQEFANTDKYNSLAVENKTVNLYAIWQPKTYNITINWNNNNGRSDTPIKLVYGVQWLDASNSELIDIEPATKAGYKFNGIKYNDIVIVDKEGNLQMGNALKAITEDDVTITPTWVANTYTVTIDDNDNDNQIVISPLSTTVTYGKKTNINGFSVNRIGYSLTGLYDSTNTGATQYFDAFGNATTEWDKDADTTLFAQWKANTYTVKFDTIGGGELDDATWEYGTAYKAEQPSARTGYEFVGWKTDDGETFNKYDSISNLTTINGRTVTLTAIWEPKSYILDYTCGEMGIAQQPEMTVRDILYGAPYTFWNGDVCHRDGYEFNGWIIFNNLNADESISTGPYNSGAITTWKFDNVSRVLTAVAQWTPKTYTLTYNCNGGNGGEKTQSVQMGTVVDIYGKICSKPGYKFVGWFNSAEDGQGTQFKDTIDWSTAGDMTLYAHWEQSKNTELNYVLSADETLVSDDDSYYSCNVLAKRELPKAVKNGSEFVGWCIGSDTCESPITVFNEGECNFTSDDAEFGQEVQLYPVFNKNTYKLYYYCGVAEQCDDENACGNVSGEITQLQTEIQYGDTLKFPAIASGCNSTGYELLGWQIEHSNRYNPDTDIVWELTDRESYTIYPVWKPAEFTVSFDANTTDGNGYAINSVTCKYNNWTNTCVAPDYIVGTLENGTKYFAGWSKDKYATNPTIAAGEHLDRIATTDTTLYAIYIDCPNAENIGGAMSRSIDTVNNVCKYVVTCSANTIKPTIVYDEAASKWIASCSACPDHSTSPEGNTLDVCACAPGYTGSSNGDICLANLYSIIYELDGGVNYANAPAQYQYGQIKTIDGIPTKKGYVFGGWCDGNLENCATSKTISATDLGDKVFYAKWTPITYKLYYNGNGASNGVKMDATTCTYNQPCTLSANEFIKPGYKFKHWTLGDKNNQLFENRANVTNLFDEHTETTLYAQWTPCDSDVSGECDCASDEHPVNGVCSGCTIYCDSTDKDYPKGHYYVCNSSKETAEAACYRDLTPADIPNSFSVFGMMFRSKLKSVQPNNLTCEDGYYPSDDWTSCEKCQAGYYCPQESGKIACPSEYPLSADGAGSIDECYKECESIISGQIVMAPDARWVYNGEECRYTRNIETPEGICVKLEGDTCAEYVSCKPGYKLNGTQCELCDVEGAVSYSSECKVLTCVTGYHAVGETCESNITDCSQQIANATVATQNWDDATNSYGACTVTECASDYHVENNTCVPNTRSCLTANGSGYQEWKDNGTWGTCIAEICEAGYEVQNDTCVVCPNALGVSSWAKGCEIAACMYQGERYILENNECIEICFESEYSDETGSRIWNPKTGRCETTCALGHKPW